MDVRLGHDVGEAELAAAGADAVVLATGSSFELPDDLPSSEAIAVWLLARDARVTVVCQEEEIVDPDGQAGLVERLLASGRIALAPGRQIASVEDGTVTLTRSGAISLFGETLEGISAIVWAAYRRPSRELASLGRRGSWRSEVHEIGDCRPPRSALEAVYEGAAVARRI